MNRWIAGLAAVVLLAGCQTQGVKDASWMPANLLGSGDRTEGLQRTMLEEALASDRPASKPEDTGKLTGFAADDAYLRYANKTTAQLPGLEAHTNQVLDRIKASWTGHPVDARVFVLPYNEFAAYTLEHGSIYIALGTLLSLENDDELAAILGHEYGHLLLKHHRKDALQQFTGHAMKAAEIYVAAKGGSKVAENYAAVKMASWVADKALFPSWGRGQENEADALGTDLMIAAGYNPDAMQSMLKKLEASMAQRQAFVAENPLKVQSTPDGTQRLQIDAATLLNNMRMSLEGNLAEEHDSARERRGGVREYLRAQYPERPMMGFDSKSLAAVLNSSSEKRRIVQYQSAHSAEDYMVANDFGKAIPAGARSLGGAIGEDPYARMLMFDIRRLKGEQDKAVTNLQKAYETGRAPMSTYRVLADRAIAAGDYAGALAYLNEIDQQFQKPREILPDLIRVNHKLGNPVSILKLRCMGSADLSLIQLCQQADKT